MKTVDLGSLVGSPTSFVVLLQDGSVVGPGLFGNYAHFVKAGRISNASEEPSARETSYGVLAEDGSIAFAEADKITDVVSEVEWLEQLQSAESAMSTFASTFASSQEPEAVSPRETSQADVARRESLGSMRCSLTTASGLVGSWGDLDKSGALGEEVRSGELEKFATSAFRGWQKRTFSLHKNALIYFTDERQDSVKMVPLNSITGVRVVNDEMHIKWVLDAGRGKERVHRLRAACWVDTEAWARAIESLWRYSPTE